MERVPLFSLEVWGCSQSWNRFCTPEEWWDQHSRPGTEHQLGQESFLKSVPWDGDSPALGRAFPVPSHCEGHSDVSPPGGAAASHHLLGVIPCPSETFPVGDPCLSPALPPLQPGGV